MRKLTYEYVVNEFEKEGYKVLTKKEEYVNTKTKLKVICPDGEYWEVKYNQFYNGQRKPCKPLSYECVKTYIENEGYELLSTKYINNSTKLKIKCPYCKTIFEVKFNNFKDNHSRCPNCYVNSKGEIKVKFYLDKYGMNYIREHRFRNCKDKRPLPFDFYLPELNTCIEYNGLQHYTKRFGMSDEDFEDRLKKDKMKIDFCEENDIKLIIIPYWEFKNIDKILNEKLNHE